MSARRQDPVVAALLAEIDAVDRVLLLAPASERLDLRQDVLEQAYRVARRGLYAGFAPGVLRALLRVVALRAVYRWAHSRRHFEELSEAREPATVMDAERLLAAKELLALAARSTSPQRWKVLRSYLVGVPVDAIAKREGLSASHTYMVIRRARADVRRALRQDARTPRRGK